MVNQSKIQQLEVIIPTHNRINDLNQTLDLLLNMGFSQGQIHIIDDGSTDDTYETIKRRFTDIDIHRFDKPRGVIVARNELWRRCKKEFVLSLDDDSSPRNIDQVIEAISILKTNSSYGIFAFNINEKGKTLNLDSQVRNLRLFTACGALFKKEILEKLEYYANTYLYFHGEELDCSIRAHINGYQVVTQNNLIVDHRVNWKKRNTKLFGKYGKIWRSANGFSANLIIAASYYPYVYILPFVALYTYKRFIRFVIMKGHVFGFLGGIFRMLLLIPKSLINQPRMQSKAFKQWVQLPVK